MSRKTQKTKKIVIDKVLFVMSLIMFLAIPVMNVYTKARLSETNIQLENIKSEIKEQKKINEGLEMEISELASLDKIQDVADENGLTYQNDNIKVVTSSE